MILQNSYEHAITFAAVLILILIGGTSLAQAKNHKSSPLFAESLHETLQEFDNGTVEIKRTTLGRRDQVKILEVDIDNDKDHDRDLPDVEVKRTTIGRHDQIKVLKVKIDNDKGPDCKLPDKVKDKVKEEVEEVKEKVKDIIEAGHQYPTMRGSTCRGVRCNGFPTLVGNTCSVTCGTRSTCSNGRFCHNHPSPCADADDPGLLAKANEKPFIFSIF
ncbi:MAG: hypothetical protein AB1847_12980 [bacterium]